MEEKLDDILKWTDKCITTRIMREPTSEDAFIVDMRLRLTEAFAEEIKRQILEQLKALLPEKRKTVKDYQGSIGMGWLLSEAEPFNEAIDQIEKAIEEWAK